MAAMTGRSLIKPCLPQGTQLGNKPRPEALPQVDSFDASNEFLEPLPS